jgi:hypothetical protein
MFDFDDIIEHAQNIIMKKMKSYTIPFIVIGILLSACEKDKPTPVKSNFEILTSHKWSMTSWTSDPAYMGMSDLYAEMAPCQKDDIQSYQKNGVIMLDLGTLKCFPTESQVDTSTRWKLNGNQIISELKISGSQVKTDTMELITLNDQKLEYFYTQKINNKTYKFTYGYSPK